MNQQLWGWQHLPNALCSKTPDLNGVENVWNKIETDLKELGKREGWPKNREELIERFEANS